MAPVGAQACAVYQPQRGTPQLPPSPLLHTALPALTCRSWALQQSNQLRLQVAGVTLPLPVKVLAAHRSEQDISMNVFICISPL